MSEGQEERLFERSEFRDDPFRQCRSSDGDVSLEFFFLVPFSFVSRQKKKYTRFKTKEKVRLSRARIYIIWYMNTYIEETDKEIML